jgi:hypothetical protein
MILGLSAASIFGISLIIYNKHYRTSASKGSNSNSKGTEPLLPKDEDEDGYLALLSQYFDEIGTIYAAHGFEISLKQEPHIKVKTSITLHHYKNNQNKIKGDGWSCAYNTTQTVLESAQLQHDTCKVPTLLELVQYFTGNSNSHDWLEPSSSAQLMGGANNLSISHNQKKEQNLHENYSHMFTVELMTNKRTWENKLPSSGKLSKDQGESVVYEFCSSEELSKKILEHFKNEKAIPLIIDDNSYSYCLIAALCNKEGTLVTHLLYQDPHCWAKGPIDIKDYEKNAMFKIFALKEFQNKSWMVLFPTLKSS